MSWLWRGTDDPKDIPQWAWLHLVTVLKVDPDYLGHLKCVEQMNFEGETLVKLIRIFNPMAVEKTTKIKSFVSLDKHPELILYEGYMEIESGKVYIVHGMVAGQADKPSPSH